MYFSLSLKIYLTFFIKSHQTLLLEKIIKEQPGLLLNEEKSFFYLNIVLPLQDYYTTYMHF
jgi:hypothetical protein